MLSSKLAGDKDPTRIAASIVSGVGFLGAGVILRERGRVVGLTTAAMIWLTAALGMTIGGGYYGLAGSTLAAMVVVLLLFPAIEHLINNIREERSYEIVGLLHARKIAGLEETISRHGLKVHGFKQKKENDRVYCTWHVSGAPAKHEALVRALVIDPEIQELHY
jgi:putative Mg2+ transporter-C (MgtC) family protein